MRIAFFDSGVGGLTVMREACRKLPSAPYLYYADTRNVPYGTHTKEEVFDFVASCFDDIVSSHEVSAIVVACNTATSAAVDELRKRYPFPIVGMEPAVKPALQEVRGTGRKVLVTATPLTLKEDKFRRLVGRLDAPEQVETLGLPGLVRLAEEGVFGGPEALAYLREQLAPFELDRYGAIVLGCTHFVFFREAFRELLPAHTLLMDGNAGTINQMVRVLDLKETPESGRKPDIVFMSSGGTEADKRKLERSFERLP